MKTRNSQDKTPGPRTLEGLQEAPFGSASGIGRIIQYLEFFLGAKQPCSAPPLIANLAAGEHDPVARK